VIKGYEALLVFVAIFWGVMLSTAVPYNPFPTALIFCPSAEGWSRAVLRLLVGVLLLNIAPIGYIGLAYSLVGSKDGCPALIGTAFISLGIFGLYRIFYAIVGTRLHKHFYNDDEWDELRRKRKSEPETFLAHFVPGILYIAVGIGIGLWFLNFTQCSQLLPCIF